MKGEVRKRCSWKAVPRGMGSTGGGSRVAVVVCVFLPLCFRGLCLSAAAFAFCCLYPLCVRACLHHALSFSFSFCSSVICALRRAGLLLLRVTALCTNAKYKRLQERGCVKKKVCARCANC